jgi:hypothetical protein
MPNGELVQRYCVTIAIGRSGMAQAELVDLIAPADPASNTAADALGNIAALQRLLRPYLMLRGELLDFFHGQLREAVQGRYLKESQVARDAHRAVADYFRRRADPAGDAKWTGNTPRALSELPYHQTRGELWNDLHATLTDLAFLEAKCTYVAVATTGTGAEKRKIYGGVYELQEDFRRALEKFPE